MKGVFLRFRVTVLSLISRLLVPSHPKPRVSWKQPLYLYKTGVRITYNIPSPNSIVVGLHWICCCCCCCSQLWKACIYVCINVCYQFWKFSHSKTGSLNRTYKIDSKMQKWLSIHGTRRTNSAGNRNALWKFRHWGNKEFINSASEKCMVLLSLNPFAQATII